MPAEIRRYRWQLDASGCRLFPRRRAPRGAMRQIPEKLRKMNQVIQRARFQYKTKLRTKTATITLIAISLISVAALARVGPFSPPSSPLPTPRSTLNTPPNLGTLADLWNGNAYFERHHYSTPEGLDEAAPFARPDINSSVIYVYYRTHHVPAGSEGAIGLAISSDGGASYSLYNGGNPIVPNNPNDCDSDSLYAVAPSVVHTGPWVGGTFYMVYEGASKSTSGCGNPGEIHLATSSDGESWIKGTNNTPTIILRHDPSSDWECNNIGTPFIGWFNNQFYVYYHGFCGPISNPYSLRNKIGMAHGTDIFNLQKNGPPVMDIGSGQYSWDSRVNSRASIIQEGGYYYMTFEGSYYVFCHQGGPLGGPNYGDWGWGIARSTDLVNWEKYIYNPIRHTFNNETACGNDLPYLFQFNGAIYVYQRESGTNNILISGSDPYLHVYTALSQCQTYHKRGGPESDGWSASTAPFVLADYLCYGPYETGLPPGKYDVNFRDMIDTTSGSDNVVMHPDINDATANSVQTSKDIYRSDFANGMTYQHFNLQFSSTAGHSYEWRTWWTNNAYIKQNLVMLRQLNGFTITIQSYPTTDTLPRSHGLSFDTPLPNPWWSPYQSGYEFESTSSAFTYTTIVNQATGSHYLQEAASGFLPSYAWHTKIFIYGVLAAEGDVARDHPLQVNYNAYNPS